MPLLVQRTFAQHQCVECHLIGDFQNLQREQDGMLDKLTHLYRSPDIKTHRHLSWTCRRGWW